MGVPLKRDWLVQQCYSIQAKRLRITIRTVSPTIRLHNPLEWGTSAYPGVWPSDKDPSVNPRANRLPTRRLWLIQTTR